MLEATQLLAVLCCTLFTGAAVYINLVEHPARLECTTEIVAAQWAPSYRRATRMQASLAIASSLAGVLAWLLGGGIAWLLGALLIGLVVPFTFVAIMPTNHRLLGPGRDPSSPETRQLLDRWGACTGCAVPWAWPPR
ncbi:DUF1772 domain-containing protein [Azotobacter salinestris]|uniref:DUF1772 domain-containing protein n=1 Tax=Azotobacter salinestris TaxID=69964 RepID=UPI0032DE5C10